MMTLFVVQTYVLIGLLLMAVGFAIPKPDDVKRVIDKPLSDEKHFEDDETHNLDYDHEAFLGEDEAREFDQLTPEESKKRLTKIVDKIDKDKDGFVTQQELRDWIKYTQKRYVINDAEKQWKAHNPENKETLTWADYKKVTYGFLEELDDKTLEEEEGGHTYKEMLRRDERRWNLADRDGNGLLTKEEFVDFLHPEEATHMQDIVVTETLEDIDKNKDGKLSIDEYIGDMYVQQDSDETEPDWVTNERQQFKEYRDKNGDGFMDRDEVREWILPPEYDHSEAESRHLVFESDTNKDQKLTKEEILEKYDLFVGSQATDFGEALTRHEEF